MPVVPPLRLAARLGASDTASGAELGEDYWPTAIEQRLADGLAVADLCLVPALVTALHTF